MKEHPILFSAPMVRAILEGRKTQTRRLVELAYTYDYKAPKGQKQQRIGKRGYIGNHLNHSRFPDGPCVVDQDGDRLSDAEFLEFCPYGQPGDRLWVRETHLLYGYWIPVTGGKKKYTFLYERGKGAMFEAAGVKVMGGKTRKPGWYRRPSIFMPRWASRILLEVVDVRVQRLQEISVADSMAEGVPQNKQAPRVDFHLLWDSINAKRGHGWEKNGWVWAVTFGKLKP